MADAVLSPRFDVALRDGSTVCVRRVEPGDQAALTRFLGELSEDARFLRFFSGGADVAVAARVAAGLHGDVGGGLIALAGQPERIVGHAEFIRERPGRAEVAFEVADAWQGRGIATVLLEQLAEDAAACGIEMFTATVLPSNHRVIAMLRDSGFGVDVTVLPGELHVELPTELGARVLIGSRFPPAARPGSPPAPICGPPLGRARRAAARRPGRRAGSAARTRTRGR
jgi:acetate---CoA ligase (ADP-forming)